VATQGPNFSASTVDWTALSPRGTAILRLIARPISEGYSQREIARRLGTTGRWVSDRLDELRDELAQLS
jgi:DNA-binding CsgD family transcriptional regulator